MAKVPYSIETLAKILTGCVGRVNVTDDRPTQRVRLHWVHIPTVTEDVLLQPVLVCCSALDVFTITRYINLHFTYLQQTDRRQTDGRQHILNVT